LSNLHPFSFWIYTHPSRQSVNLLPPDALREIDFALFQIARGLLFRSAAPYRFQLDFGTSLKQWYLRTGHCLMFFYFTSFLQMKIALAQVASGNIILY
jgi:hypothetical protein